MIKIFPVLSFFSFSHFFKINIKKFNKFNMNDWRIDRKNYKNE